MAKHWTKESSAQRLMDNLLRDGILTTSMRGKKHELLAIFNTPEYKPTWEEHGDDKKFLKYADMTISRRLETEHQMSKYRRCLSCCTSNQPVQLTLSSLSRRAQPGAQYESESIRIPGR